MLKLGVATLGLAAVLGAMVLIGKSAVENYKAQEEALLSLTQAVNVHNEQLGKTIPVSEEAQSAIATATDAAANADDALTLAQDSVTLALMNYSEAVKAHGAKSDQAIKASIHLKDANLHLVAAQTKASETADDLAAAESVTATTVQGATLNVDELHARVKAFIATNEKYISNQYNVETAMASIIRAGYDEETAFQILNDALDLSVIKHEDVTDAEKQLILALAGNKRVLKELGISNDEFDAIMKSKTLTTAEKHIKLLALIETHTKDGKKNLDDNTQSQNELTKSWQDFTERVGPPLLDIWSKLNQAAATGLGIISVYLDLNKKLSQLVWGTGDTSTGFGPGGPTVVQGNNYSGAAHARNFKTAAAGFSGTVSQPTLFLAGEGGAPEDVNIGPRGSGAGNPVVHVHIGTFVGDARELSKILAHELRISGAFR